MDLGRSATAACRPTRCRGPRRDPRRLRGRDRPLPRPVAGRDGADRARPVLAVQRHAGADARDGRARPRARRAAAHAHGRDRGRGALLPRAVRRAARSSTSERLGWLGDDVWLAHCVHLDEREVRRFGETGTGVAHCPSSNARLGAGIAPVPALIGAGAPVGLGVDGAASNEAGELGGELRQALLVARLAARARGADRPRGARAGHDPRRPLPRPRGRDRLARARQARRRRAVAARRRRPRRDRGPGRRARARPAPARRHAAGRRPRGRRGRRAAHGDEGVAARDLLAQSRRLASRAGVTA